MMGRRPDQAVVEPLRTLFDVGPLGDLADGPLLERFGSERPEVAELAFAVLVERHAALVWRVCRSKLRDEHQAEDAFQATFVVLVRKARSLWVEDSLGPWLHQVACRTAAHLHAAQTRRQQHERFHAEQAVRRVSTPATETPRDWELEAAIHAEVARLPAKLRDPVVLCDLEGRTHGEAARALGWPVGTVKTRQARGRSAIRAGLLRRGFGLAASGIGLDSWSRAARAGVVSPALTRRVVGGAAAGVGSLGVSQTVVTLARGVVRTMFWSQLRLIVVPGILALGVGAGAVVGAGQGPQGPASAPSPVPKSDPGTQAPAGSIPSAEPGDPALARPTRAQQLATRKARIMADLARSHRDLAQLAVEEYEAVKYPQELAVADAKVKLAEAAQARAQDRIEWSTRMLEKKYVSRNSNVADKLTLERAKFDVEQVLTERDVLTKYTHDKRLKALRVDVDNANDEALKREAAWTTARAAEAQQEVEPQPPASPR